MSGLADLLELDRPEKYAFIGGNPSGKAETERLFGGQAIAQALIAAGATVDADREVHSLHSYFLLAGNPELPILYRVNPIRDGRSYTTRRVVAEQEGREIFAMTTSFAVHEDGLRHQVLAPPGLTGAWQDRPGPPVLLPEQIDDNWMSEYTSRRKWMELRRVTEDLAGDQAPHLRVWGRLTEPLEGGQVAQVAGLAYLSDMLMLPTATFAHGIRRSEGTMIASLDHAMWFHHPFRADDWLLHEIESPVASHGRALTRAQIFTRDGLLVASVAQEGVIRTSRSSA